MFEDRRSVTTQAHHQLRRAVSGLGIHVESRGEQATQLVVVEGFESDFDSRTGLGGAGVGIRALGSQQHHREAVEVGADLSKNLRTGHIGPVDVIDNDHHGMVGEREQGLSECGEGRGPSEVVTSGFEAL